MERVFLTGGLRVANILPPEEDNIMQKENTVDKLGHVTYEVPSPVTPF